MERSKEEQALILQTVRELDPRCGHPLFFAGFYYPCDCLEHHSTIHYTRIALVNGDIAFLTKPLNSRETRRIWVAERAPGTFSFPHRCMKSIGPWYCMGPSGLAHVCKAQYVEEGTSASCRRD